jgi:hypothetical protein
MIPHLLLLTLAPVPVDAPPRAVDTAIVCTYNLAMLTPEQAQRLTGKRVRYRLELNSSEAEIAGYVSFDCCTNDDTHKTVDLVAWDEVADVMELEARLIIRRHAGWGPFPAFTEYRLMDARRCQ